MDEQRLDKLQSSRDFQGVGLGIHDAVVNKGRVKREAALAKRKADKKLARMRKKEDKKRLKAAMRAQPPTLFRKVKRFVVTIFLLAVASLVWLYALSIYWGSN